MAFQNADKRKGAQINRTPAPDEITNIRNPGAFSPGTNGAQPASIMPGQAAESILGKNLRESQADSEDVLSQVIAKGVSGRGDDIPADGNDQLREVSAKMYPATFGMKRQQADYSTIGRPNLPAATTKDEQQPVRKPTA